MANEKYMDFYTKSEINAMLNGLSFKKMSKADYDALTTVDPNTIYYVYDENGKITQYMGETKMAAGQATGGVMSALCSGVANSIQGQATFDPTVLAAMQKLQLQELEAQKLDTMEIIKGDEM